MEDITITICYEKLWKTLTDRNVKRKDLMALSGISQSSVTKMGHNGNVDTDVPVRICHALQCDIGDIAEVILLEAKKA